MRDVITEEQFTQMTDILQDEVKEYGITISRSNTGMSARINNLEVVIVVAERGGVKQHVSAVLRDDLQADDPKGLADYLKERIEDYFPLEADE